MTKKIILSFINTLFITTLILIFLFDINTFTRLILLPKNFYFTLNILLLFTGFITFYFIKDNIEKKIRDDEEKINISKNLNQNKVSILNNISKLISYNEWIFIVILLLTTILGFLLRIHNLGNPSLWMDEVTLVFTGKNFLNGEGMTLLSGQTYYYSISSTIILAISFFINGISEFSARIPFVLIGTSTIILNYFIVKKIIKNKNIALISSFSISISLWLINYSREIRFYSLNIFITYIIIYFFYKYILEQRNKYFIYSFFLILLGAINHRLMLIFIPIWVILYLFISKDIFKISKIRQTNFTYLILITTITITTFLFFKSTILFFLSGPKNYDFWNNGTFFYFKLFYEKFTFLSFLFLLSVPVTLLLKNIKYKFIFYINIFILAIFSFIITAKVERYILIIYPFIIILSITTLYYILSTLIQNKILPIVLCVLLTASSITPIYDGFMVGMTKVSYISGLQKNKYSWREGTQFLKKYIQESNLYDTKVISSNGMLTTYYGLKTDYTIKRTSSQFFTNSQNIIVDRYDGLRFIETLDGNINYFLILDANNIKEDVFSNFIEKYEMKRIYNHEGISVFST